jgi:DNA (cytosine-5)-methyltransferase 1
VVNELALFAGAGGGILGGKLLGWKTVCAVECDSYAASVLVSRQNDGILEPFPIWDDVKTFDGKPWRGIVNVVSGGFPCQDVSQSSPTATGIEGERSGLWMEMARIVCEVRPQYVFVENSPMLTSRGLGRVLGDLAQMGFDAKWGVLGVHHVSPEAPHERDRIWIMATNPGCRRLESYERRSLHHQNRNQKTKAERRENKQDWAWCPSWWESKPDICRVDDGVVSGMDRLRAIGNGQVPAVARLAWDILNKEK